MGAREFDLFVRDLLDVIRRKGWGSFVVLCDEANRLTGKLPVELLVSNEEALNAAGVVSVYAASPDMAESFAPLSETFSAQVRVGPFAEFSHLLALLARYYFDDTARVGDLPVTEEAVRELWRVTGGKPYLIQLVAGYSFRQAHLHRADRVSADHVAEARAVLLAEKPELQLGPLG